MEKIPTIYERDWEGDRSRVLDKVVPGCEWVLEGEGVATRKYDGTCVMFDGTEWWARREVKEGKEPPPGFRPVAHDHKTLAAIGWQPIADSPFAKFHAEAVAGGPRWDTSEPWKEGTYELIGPKIQGNPEKYERNALIFHADADRYIVPRTFDTMRDVLAQIDAEGFVFHHDDGRRTAKIKARDFGLKRGERVLREAG